MKIIGSFLLILIIALPITLNKAWIYFQKYNVKREVKSKILNGIDDSELTKFIVAKKELKTALKWEDDEEFEFNDVMYDVVHQSESIDSITYWCFADVKESQLNKNIRLMTELIWQKSNIPLNEHRKINEFLKTLVFVPIQIGNLPIDFYKNISKSICSKCFHLKQIFTSVPFPPPEY